MLTGSGEEEERLAAKKLHAVLWQDGLRSLHLLLHIYIYRATLGLLARWQERKCRVEQYQNFGADTLQTLRIGGRACVKGERFAHIVLQQAAPPPGLQHMLPSVAVTFSGGGETELMLMIVGCCTSFSESATDSLPTPSQSTGQELWNWR